MNLVGLLSNPAFLAGTVLAALAINNRIFTAVAAAVLIAAALFNIA